MLSEEKQKAFKPSPQFNMGSSIWSFVRKKLTPLAAGVSFKPSQ